MIKRKSKVNKKYAVNVKAIFYIEDNVIRFENSDTGELMPLAPLLEDFDGKECTLSVAFAEEVVD